MEKKPRYKEPLSTILRRHPHGSKSEIIPILSWVGNIALFLFLTLILFNLLMGNYLNTLAISVGIIPIIVSLMLLRRDAVSVPSTILAVTIIVLITWLATFGQGLYDIGVLGYPVILIVAGLILRGRVIQYLALLIIVCLGWLAFGDLFDIYEPIKISESNPEDFFIGSIIILVAGNSVYRLVRNVYQSLSKAEDEVAMRKEAEKGREAVIHQLRLKNQELDRFAIRVSHDLKTPLITIAGFLGYLEKDIKEGDLQRVGKNLAQINDAARQMGKFVDELLDLSRVGRITNLPTDAPFDEIVQDALKAADGLLKARQVQVKVEAIFPFVHVDRVRVVQVVLNLITNGIKFMGSQKNPLIEIGFKEIDGEHIFFVCDNGIGIEPEYQERVFELFNKLDPASDGTGIGLALVKRIVEAHSGKIWVESEIEKGATFFFTLANKIHKET